ncbi:uroporphyrinogen-III synthase isoform X2 [Scleropages formosus]|uniref:Uroporphyrinogen III synthase n=1 Tax=Scleropages formosus TaxID=113540 RepID=A0A8C9RJA5_SCLFO|nr:uroporphyrinogen-III synthase isoform X2 [Scleropages formosus]
MNVLLLKEPREDDSGPDPYVKELGSFGHKATLIPVLSFKFVSLERLWEKLRQPEEYAGLIFTSPRAVEAVSMCLESANKTEMRNLGLNPQGEDSGTATVLSRFILEKENCRKLPLFFPCGSLKREVLPTTLKENGVPLETLTVYQTVEHPELEKHLTDYFTDQGVPASIAFFSPSGVKFCLETIRRLSGPKLNHIKFAAIGPTTADAIAAEGLEVNCSAAKPTAQHLAEGIARSLQ